MSTSRRSFFKLAAAAPFAAPEIVRAVQAELSRARFGGGLYGPATVTLEDLISNTVRAAQIRSVASSSEPAVSLFEMNGGGPIAVAADHPFFAAGSVLDQMRDHDIFDLDEVAV